MLSLLALRLLRGYPLPWRERYEAEVCALIEDSSLRWRDVAELLRGMVVERVRELLSSTEHPKRTVFVLGMMKPVVGLFLIGTATLAGVVLQPALRTLPWAGDAAAVAGSIIYLLLMVTVIRRGVRQVQQLAEPVYSAWIGGLTLIAWFVIMMVMTGSGALRGSSGRSFDYFRWFQYALYSFWTIELLSSFFPRRQLLAAFAELTMAERSVQSSEQWVAGCHEWIAKGVASPLAAAESQFASATRRRDDAQERLRALGYSARFRHHRLTGVSA